MSELMVADPRGDADFEAFARIDAQAFGAPLDRTRRWVAAGRPLLRFRVALVGDEVVGGYALMPMGQFYGGRSVPAQGVVAVVVSPLWRRRGAAGAMMRDLVAICRETNTAVAPLYAATVRLYRRWGWEVADRAVNHTVRTDALVQLRGDGIPVNAPPAAALEALRRSYLFAWDGPLDRPDSWLSIQGTPEDVAEHSFLYGWEENGRLTGFMRYRYGSLDGTEQRVIVDEIHATTLDATHGLLGLLGANESIYRDVVFHMCLGAKSDLLYVLSDASKSVRTEGHLCWMQRVVDVRAALQARGWAAHVAHPLELEVADPALDTTERFTVDFAGGRALVDPGGSGRVRCSVGALSAWYAGTLRAQDAARLQLMSGPPDDLVAMDGLIGGRPTWMPDHF
jgi:predicted acetyltransferase